jgi:hypothetical protein
VTVQQVNLKTMFLRRPPKPWTEASVALAGTAFAAVLLVLKAMNAGALWRDETNTLNLAQMPSLKELWDNMPFESFPPFWPLLLRGWSFPGMADSDTGIRLLGLFVGFLFLASLWFCSRWTGGRAPILSIALLSCLPAFIFIVGANRAYGLASCLLVLSFGMIWRMVEYPSRSRVLSAGLTCILFAQCVYYDMVFLCAMLSGAAMVAIRRQQWKTLGTLIGIGTVSGASMMIYLPIIRRGSTYAPMIEQPFFVLSILWNKLCNAVTTRSSASFDATSSREVWLWIALLLGGTIVALMTQLTRERQAHNQEAAAAVTVRVRADRALFCVVSMLFGVFGYLAFLLRLHYLTQTWYYIEMLILCAISLDGLLGANWPMLRPWGLLRIGFMVVMMTWGARSAWAEAHTRRSNVDLIAAVLEKDATKGDLIVVQGAWEGITFNRYYHGQAPWVTVPPIDSHEVHRNDLVLKKMKEPDPMAPVLGEITHTLRSGNHVWVVRTVTYVEPKQLPKPPKPPPHLPTRWWLAPYLDYWSAQVTVQLRDHALQEQVLKIPMNGAVSHSENLSVLQFTGYRSNAD